MRLVDRRNDAQQQGADLATYCKVSEFIRDESGQITGVKVSDELTGREFSIAADCVVNATGPWSDRTRALMGHQGQLLRPTKGIHVVVDSERLPLQHAVVLAVGDINEPAPIEHNRVWHMESALALPCRTPLADVGAAVAEYDDPRIAVAVGDVDLASLCVDGDIGRCAKGGGATAWRATGA